MNIDFATINFAPFIIAIVLGIILVFVIEKIGSSAMSNSGGGTHFGDGDSKDAAENLMQFVADKASGVSNAAHDRHRHEAAQRALVRQIKIAGLIAGIALIIAISSLFGLLDAAGKVVEKDYGPIIIPAAGLIMGTVVAIAFALRFFQLKRNYELYYGSIFGKKQ